MYPQCSINLSIRTVMKQVKLNHSINEAYNETIEWSFGISLCQWHNVILIIKAKMIAKRLR